MEKTEEEQAQERAEEARRINARIAESRKRAEIGGGKDTVANAGVEADEAIAPKGSGGGGGVPKLGGGLPAAPHTKGCS